MRFALPPELLTPLTVAAPFVVAFLVLFGVRFLLLRRLRGWAAGTESRVDDIVLAAVHTPSIFWCVAIALEIGLRISPLPAELRDVLTRAIQVLVVVSMSLVAASVAGGLVTVAIRRRVPDGKVPGLGQAVARGLVLLVGAMVALNILGVEIAPLLTALGVGGLAVALALQDTLTNFFAGLHILLERPYAIGHFIRLEDGQEGHVMDIGWRTTRIRTLADDVIVVPNSKMAGSTIVNFHMPIPRSRLTMRVGVDYGSDLDRVQAILEDEATRAAAELDYLLADPAPDALVTRFAEFSVDFELRFFVKDVAREPRALDEMHRRVFRRFKAEGIEIPFPVRRVLIDKV